MKNKKFLVIIITILLCFTMYQKPKRVEAFDLVITPTVLWVLGTLVLGTGIVAINKEQVLDMGQKVWDKVGELGFQREVIDYDVNTLIPKGIIWTKKLSNVINAIADILPSSSVLTPSVGISTPNYFDIPSGYTGDFGYISIAPGPYIGLSTVLDFSNNSSGTPAIPSHSIDTGDLLKLGYPSMLKVTIEAMGGSSGVKSFVLSTLEGVRVGAYATYGKLTSIIVNYYGEASDFVRYSAIPYDNPLIREDYSPDVLPTNETWDKEKSWGYVPVPTTIPANAGSISADMPLSWDNVKGEVGSIPRGDVYDDSIDMPQDMAIDDVAGSEISEGLSLWGWLKALLMAILNFIKGIFDLIKSIVNFIADFFSNLIKALLGFITSLFTVSDTYFVDMFNSFKDKFSSKLNYNSYLDFLDYGYSPNAIKDITVNWFGQEIVIVKLSLFEHFRSAFNTFVYGIMFFLLAMYNYNQVYKLIRSVDLTNPSSPSQFQIDLQASRKNKNLGG